jgi:hypothetical protein
MHQQLWGYNVEEKLYVGVREQKRLNTTALVNKRKAVTTNIFIGNFTHTMQQIIYFTKTPG